MLYLLAESWRIAARMEPIEDPNLPRKRPLWERRVEPPAARRQR
ncbi:hypothetical protein [Roseobacter sp. HKCCA0434]|nr:hypothetical protein [Roseobacter sp. HKCCA0434]